MEEREVPVRYFQKGQDRTATFFLEFNKKAVLILKKNDEPQNTAVVFQFSNMRDSVRGLEHRTHPVLNNGEKNNRKTSLVSRSLIILKPVNGLRS